MKNNFLYNIVNLIINKYKKWIIKIYYFWDVIIIAIWLIFFFKGYITVKKILIFVMLLFIILIYKKIFEFIQYYNFNKKNYIQNKQLYILLKVAALSNFILFILLRLELKLYDFFNYLNKKIKQKNINKFIWVIFMSCLVLPPKIIISRFYKLLENFNKLTMYKILCKRAFGSILSVIIFSDLMKFLVEMTGSLIYLYLYIYIVICLICFFDYFFNILKIFVKMRLEDTMSLHEKKKKISILYSLILKIWNNNITEHNYFMQTYNANLCFECFLILNIKSYSLWVTKYKIIIVNNEILLFNNKNILSTSLIKQLKYNLVDLFENLLVLEFYYLYKKIEKPIDNMINNNYEIIIKINEFYISNYNAIKVILFFIWDLELQSRFDTISKIKIDKLDLGYVYFNFEDEFLFNANDYGSAFKNELVDNKDLLLLYDISLLNIQDDVWLESCNKMFNKEAFSSKIFAKRELQEQFKEDFMGYASNLVELLIRIRCNHNNNKYELEQQLEIRLNKIYNIIYNEWLDNKIKHNEDVLDKLKDRINQLNFIKN